MDKDDFVNAAADILEEHFPKGKTNMRGEAMVLVADIARLLLEKGLLTDATDDRLSGEVRANDQVNPKASPSPSEPSREKLREQLDSHATAYARLTKQYIFGEITETERDKLWGIQDQSSESAILALFDTSLEEEREFAWFAGYEAGTAVAGGNLEGPSWEEVREQLFAERPSVKVAYTEATDVVEPPVSMRTPDSTQASPRAAKEESE